MTAERGSVGQSLVGVPVYTRDGERIGRVKEVRSRAFKVDAPRKADYWVGGGHIASAADTRVTLDIVKRQLGGCKIAAPAGQDTAGWTGGAMVGPAVGGWALPGKDDA